MLNAHRIPYIWEIAWLIFCHLSLFLSLIWSSTLYIYNLIIMVETVWGYVVDLIIIAALFMCISAHLRLFLVWNGSLVKGSIPLKLKQQPFLNNVNESCQSSPLWSATTSQGLTDFEMLIWTVTSPAPLKIQLIQVFWESFEGCFRLSDCQRCQTWIWCSVLARLQQESGKRSEPLFKKKKRRRKIPDLCLNVCEINQTHHNLNQEIVLLLYVL